MFILLFTDFAPLVTESLFFFNEQAYTHFD